MARIRVVRNLIKACVAIQRAMGSRTVVLWVIILSGTAVVLSAEGTVERIGVAVWSIGVVTALIVGGSLAGVKAGWWQASAQIRDPVIRRPIQPVEPDRAGATTEGSRYSIADDIEAVAIDDGWTVAELGRFNSVVDPSLLARWAQMPREYAAREIRARFKAWKESQARRP